MVDGSFCPMLSAVKKELVPCNSKCAWFTEDGCALVSLASWLEELSSIVKRILEALSEEDLESIEGPGGFFA